MSARNRSDSDALATHRSTCSRPFVDSLATPTACSPLQGNNRHAMTRARVHRVPSITRSDALGRTSLRGPHRPHGVGAPATDSDPGLDADLDVVRGPRRTSPDGAERRAAPGPVPGPRAQLARVQRAGAGTGRGPGDAPAGTGQLPGDLRQQPGRVLHGPGRRPEAPHRHRRRHPLRLRPAAPRGPGADLDPLARAHGPARRLLPAGRRPGARRGGHPPDPLGRADREGAGPPLHAVPAADLPGAHPAGRRPGAPLPVHLGPVAQPRRRRAQPGQRPPATSPG